MRESFSEGCRRSARAEGLRQSGIRGKEVAAMRWKTRLFNLLLALMMLASLIIASGGGGKWD